MFGLGPTELIVIAVIILFFFGAKRLPEIGKGLGSSISEFRKVKKEFQKDDKGEESAETKEEKGAAGFVEQKIKEKLVDSVPGVRQARRIKDKADKIKSVIN